MSVRSKKSLGQHFLLDLNMAHNIVEALDDKPKAVLEVGPGPGVLTKFLIQKSELFDLRFVELDTNLYGRLKNQFPKFADRFWEGDVLKQDWEQLFPETFQVIGNFPYNISSQIVFKIIEHKDRVDAMVGMFQKEMAERICSPVGKKSYGVITVLTQLYYEAELLYVIPPEAFDPPPKVHSAVIKLRRKKLDPDVKYKEFARFVKKAFSQRRKKIKNALKGELVIEKGVFQPFQSLRAENLSVEDYILLVNNNSN